ncbi:MAG TPA: hypothetical protein VGH10_09910 [Actinomycetota bacterium]|jgi:hypothetical protein
MDETERPGAASAAGDGDVFAEALSLIGGAQEAGIPVRLVGGLAVRYLTPDYPPRARDGQDLDMASVSAHRRPLSEFLVGRGYQADKTFNSLYGHKQLYFASPSGRTIDVLIDKLEMSHTLTFTDRIERLPHTLDAPDLLLSKLQIFELNRKDAQDVIYLASAFEVRDGDEPGTLGLGRVCAVVAEDWGWWRTVTMNLDKIRALAEGDGADLVPADRAFDPAAQLRRLREAADEAPKSLKWKLRAKVGDRKRWYELPEETEHY